MGQACCIYMWYMARSWEVGIDVGFVEMWMIGVGSVAGSTW